MGSFCKDCVYISLFNHTLCVQYVNAEFILLHFYSLIAYNQKSFEMEIFYNLVCLNLPTCSNALFLLVCLIVCALCRQVFCYSSYWFPIDCVNIIILEKGVRMFGHCELLLLYVY